MKKLTLNVDHLQVESFRTTPLARGRGTVQARESGAEHMTCIWTCFGEETRDGLCPPEDTYYIGCGSGYTGCEPCTTYGNPGGGDACMRTDESECRTQTAC